MPFFQLIETIFRKKGNYLIKNIRIGGFNAFIALLTCCGYAGLVFTENLLPFLSYGIGTFIVTAAVVNLVYRKITKIEGVIAGPQNIIALLIAIIGASLAQSLSISHQEDQIFPSLIFLIFLSTIAFACLFYIFGAMNWGGVIRFIPYPVVCGVLGGTGWVLFKRSLSIITSFPITLENLPLTFQESYLYQIFLSIFLGFLFITLLKKQISSIVLISVIGLGILFALIVPTHWLIGPVQEGRIWPPEINLIDIYKINFKAVLEQIPQIGALLFTMLIVFLFNLASLEVFTEEEIDIEKELKSIGLSNFFVAIFGGVTGSLNLYPTIINLKQDGKDYLSVVISSLLLGSLLFIDASKFGLIPKIYVAAIPLYVGLDFLLDWGFRIRKKVSHLDYFMIITIILIIGFFGFLEGVISGIIIGAMIFIFNYSQINAIKYIHSGALFRSNIERPRLQQNFLKEKGEELYVVKLQGYLFFGTAYKLLREIKDLIQNNQVIKFIIIDFSHVLGVDSSGIEVFNKLTKIVKDKRIVIIFSAVKPIIHKQLSFNGFVDNAYSFYHFFPNLDYSIEWCEEQFLMDKALNKDTTPPISSTKMKQYFKLISLNKGEYLFHQGEKSDALYFIISGTLTVVSELADGSSRRVSVSKEGAILGELGFFLDKTRSFSVISSEKSTLYKITREALATIKSQHPELVYEFYENTISILSERVIASNIAIQFLTQ